MASHIPTQVPPAPNPAPAASAGQTPAQAPASAPSAARARLAAVTEEVTTRVKRFRHALGIPGTLAIAVLVFGQLIAQQIQMVMDSPVDVVLGILGTGLVILLLTYRWTSHLPGAVGLDSYGNNGNPKLPTRRGLVVLCGLDSAQPGTPAATLFASVPNAEYVAFIGTPETAYLGVAHELRTRVAPAAGLVVPDAHVRTWEFGNAESVSDAEQATTEAIRWMLGRGLDPSEIVVDVSAGRRAMGYGAKDAADAALVETQYLASAWDPPTNRPMPGTQMFKVIKAYH